MAGRGLQPRPHVHVRTERHEYLWLGLQNPTSAGARRVEISSRFTLPGRSCPACFVVPEDLRNRIAPVADGLTYTYTISCRTLMK
jgi:hypothetical protein